MKKNRFIKLASGLLVLCLMTTCVIGATLAKYTTAKDTQDSARVAKWGVRISAAANSAFKTEYDKDDNSYIVSMPQDTTSFNPSFFLGLFFQSIKNLGIDEFQKKYIFSYDNLYESLRDVIRNNIDLSITRAKKDLSGMTGLDSYL